METTSPVAAFTSAAEGMATDNATIVAAMVGVIVVIVGFKYLKRAFT